MSELQLFGTIGAKNESRTRQFFSGVFYYTICLYYKVKVCKHFIDY